MSEIKQNLLSTSLWLRIFYMVIFYIVAKVVWLLIMLIAVVQTLSNLVTGKVIQPIWIFSYHLNAYMLQIFDFLIFRCNSKPFPFSDWPENKQDTINVIHEDKTKN